MSRGSDATPSRVSPPDQSHRQHVRHALGFAGRYGVADPRQRQPEPAALSDHLQTGGDVRLQQYARQRRGACLADPACQAEGCVHRDQNARRVSQRAPRPRLFDRGDGPRTRSASRRPCFWDLVEAASDADNDWSSTRTGHPAILRFTGGTTALASARCTTIGYLGGMRDSFYIHRSSNSTSRHDIWRSRRCPIPGLMPFLARLL